MGEESPLGTTKLGLTQVFKHWAPSWDARGKETVAVIGPKVGPNAGVTMAQNAGADVVAAITAANVVGHPAVAVAAPPPPLDTGIATNLSASQETSRTPINTACSE